MSRSVRSGSIRNQFATIKAAYLFVAVDQGTIWRLRWVRSPLTSIHRSWMAGPVRASSRSTKWGPGWLPPGRRSVSTGCCRVAVTMQAQHGLRRCVDANLVVSPRKMLDR